MGLYVLITTEGGEIETLMSLAEAARVACDEYKDFDIEIQYHEWVGEGQDARKQVSFEGYAGAVYDELGLDADD